MREHGISGGQDAYNDFITRLANSHSVGMHSAGFCQMADTLLTLAGNAGESDISILARNFSEKPAGVGASCGASTAAAVTVAAPVPAVAADPPEVAPVAMAETAPAPADPAAQVKPQSAAAALEAAAVALQSAAASLKAQPSAEEAAVKPALVADSKPVS